MASKALTTQKSGTKLTQMNENLFKVYEQELAERSCMIRRNLRFHRDRGKVISRVKAGRSLDDKANIDYGQNPVEVLADNLGISRSYAYKLATFYEMYQDNEKFQDLLDKFDDSSFDLSWSHFNCLVHVKDEDTREEIIEEVLTKKLSVRGLHDLLSSKKITIDDDLDEAVSEPVYASKTESASQPLLTEQSDEDTEEDEEDEEPQEVTAQPVASGDDWVSADSPKATLRKLVGASAKFGDKLIELVGDLTISTNEINGSECDKDIFKGLDSSIEVLQTLSGQVSEYLEQVQNIKGRLVSEKRGK